MRSRCLTGNVSSIGPDELVSLIEILDVLIERARDAANSRDYITLCIRDAVLHLLTDTGTSPQRLLELCRAITLSLATEPTTQGEQRQALPLEQTAMCPLRLGRLERV
ncbi:hypothetical protein CORC01_03873 [Colletotrichum orchidophilum]|uniref:Uncharacterized protein n=1 Tax=Colletotrichum orchidophilum TaxID=1209926 RepID=A0A1G4BHC2_9PEZI|nr:uncharacterized protein CORC01_03873 [Colletotrichum orchidophilum]OHF00799.1 hypothetical protein CORC01_03873 [Colletotrichum orchidophilum]